MSNDTISTPYSRSRSTELDVDDVSAPKIRGISSSDEHGFSAMWGWKRHLAIATSR